MLRSPGFGRFLTIIGVALLAMAIAWGFAHTRVGQRLELQTHDARARIRQDVGHPSPSRKEILVLKINDASDSAVTARWPWPRRLHADALDTLVQVGARAVVFDIQFLDSDRQDPNDRINEQSDQEFLDAIKRAQQAGIPVVLATAPDRERAKERRLPLPFDGLDAARGIKRGTTLAATGARLGLADVNLAVDTSYGIDRVVRYALVEKLGTIGDTRDETDGNKVRTTVPSLARAAIDAAGYTPSDTLSRRSSFGIDWDTQPSRIPHANYATAVLGNLEKLRQAQGKVVFVGVTSPVYHDLINTPVQKDLPGVYLHVQSYLNQRDGAHITRVPASTTTPIVGVLALLMAWGALGRYSRRVLFWSLACTAIVAGLIAVIFVAGIRFGLMIEVVSPVLALTLSAVALIVYDARQALQERRQVTTMFSRYLAPTVVKDLVSSDALDVAPGGTEHDISILFSDLRNFTAQSEGVDASSIVEQLNAYFEEMVEAVDEHGGTVDKFLGDGLMAFFGAPIPQNDHAARACACARSMLSRLETLNERRAANSLDPIGIGVGIASGTAIVGNIGSSRRLEYTAIGEPVNLASRLEGLSKRFDTPVIVASDTAKQAPLERFNDLGAVGVRGLSEHVHVVSLAIGDPGASPTEPTPGVRRSY